MIEKLNPAEEFVESLGLVAEADGMPRIAGRILGLLIVEEGPFQFDDIVERLKVSRGSVSTNTRHLERLGIVERFTVPGERRDFFRLSEGHYERLLLSHLERLRRIQDIVERCREGLSEAGALVGNRLASMSRFYALAIRSSESVLGEWRDQELDAGAMSLNNHALGSRQPARKSNQATEARR